MIQKRERYEEDKRHEVDARRQKANQKLEDIRKSLVG